MKSTDKPTLAGRARHFHPTRLMAIAVMTAIVLQCAPPIPAFAVSTWNPTLLVNTESFQQIDAGDSTTDIVLRFGGTASTLTLLTTNIFRFNRSLSVLGTVSGSALRIDGNAEIHGSLSLSGAIRTDSAALTLNDDQTATDVTITFGSDGLNETLQWFNTADKFSFSDDLDVVGTISGTAIKIWGNTAATFSGAIVSESSFSGTSLYGAGLGSCSNATSSKLLYNSATGKFSCGTDQTGGGTGGGLGYGAIEGMFVNQGGDTMTGALSLQTSAPLLPTQASVSGAVTLTETTVVSSGNVGDWTTIAIAADGLPIIAHSIDTGEMLITKCGNSTCSSGNTTTTVSVSLSARALSMAIAPDGFPVIAYNNFNSLYVVKCSDISCATAPTDTAVDNATTVGEYVSLAIGRDGLPVISYYDQTNTALKVAKCGNAACTSGNTTTTVESAGTVGLHNAIAVGTDGLPVVSYYNAANLYVTKCGNAACSAGNNTNNLGSGGFSTHVVVPPDNLPLIAHVESSQLYLVKCGNAACTSGNTSTLVDSSSASIGRYSSIALGSDGLPVISYYDTTNTQLRFTKCGNSACSSGNVSNTVDTGNVGEYTSVTIARNGFPVISYADGANSDLKTLHCADLTCTATTSTAYTGGSFVGAFKANERSYVNAFDMVSTTRITTPNLFQNLTFSLFGIDRMTITPTGRVGVGTSDPETALDVVGTISGTAIKISGSTAATFSGAIVSESSFSGTSLYGAGLGSCSNATSSKLLYNSATGKFSCATARYVSTSGDTMTGTLTINVTSDDVVKTTTGTEDSTDFSKAGSTLLNATSSNDMITMDVGTIPSSGQGTMNASSVVTTANVGAGAHTILRDDGQYIIFLGNASTTVNRWDGISTTMSVATAATTAIGAGALSLRRPDGRYLVVPGGGSSTAFVYDPYNITANSSVTLTSCAGTTGTNAFLVSTGSYVITCGGSGNWGLYNATGNTYFAGTALGASFGAGSHAIQRDDGTFLVFAGGGTSTHWIFHPGALPTQAWSAINPIANAPTISTGGFSIRRSDGDFLVVGGAQHASTIYDPASSATDRFGTFTAQSGVGYGPSAALGDGAQALWRPDRKYLTFIGGSSTTTNIVDISRNDQYQFVTGPSMGATPGAGLHAFYNARGTVQLLLGGATTVTRYYDVGYVRGGPSTSTGSYFETECITTVIHSGSYLTWKMNGDDQKVKVYVKTGNGACSGNYNLIPKNGDLIRATSGHNRIQMKVVFERLPAKFADQEWGLRRGLSQVQYRRLLDIPALYEIVLRNTANLHRTQFEFGRGGNQGEPLGVNLVNNGDKNLQLQLANTAAYPTTINASNTNFYNGAFTSAPNLPRTVSIGTVVLKRSDGKFVIIPGSSTGSTAQQRSMIYDQDANVFYNNSASPTMALSSGALAFKRHDGTFLIAVGGNRPSTNIYDPVANTFVDGPPLQGLVREGSQVMAMPNGRVTIIHGGFQKTTTIYDSVSNQTITGAVMLTTVGRGSFVIPKPDGKYLVAPGVSTQACALRTTTMLFDPYANFFNNGIVVTTTGTGPGAYAVERTDGMWMVIKGGGTAGTCAGVTATQLYNPFVNKMLVGPVLSAATRYGSTAMQRPDGTWLITAGGSLTTTSIVNEKSGAFTTDGVTPVGASNTGPALVTAAGTGSLAFQRDDGKYVLLTGANAIGSPGTAVAQIYDPAWVIDGYYRSEPINITNLDSTSTLSWQSPDYRGIAARVRTGTSALMLQTASDRELESSGDAINPGTGHTWLQVNFSFRRYLPPNKGIYEDVWYNGGAMPQVNYRQIPTPSIQQFSVGKDKDIANFKVDETSLFRVNGNGDIYTGTKGALFSGGADLAERYHSSDHLRPGELVTFDYDDDHAVRRTSSSYQPELLGVISTNPGFVAGAYTKDSYPVALVGRVPVNVSLENGPVKTGDRLTSASLPGYAMKATRAGRVIGVALESSKPESIAPCPSDPKKMCGQVMIFVNLSDWPGPLER